jgi:hypothetical protein
MGGQARYGLTQKKMPAQSGPAEDEKPLATTQRASGDCNMRR